MMRVILINYGICEKRPTLPIPALISKHLAQKITGFHLIFA